jgi:hypothetical protein
MALLMELAMLLGQASMALARVGMCHTDAVHWTWSQTKGVGMQRNRGRAHRHGLGRSAPSRWNGSRGLGAAAMRTSEELRCSGGSFLPRSGTLHLHGLDRSAPSRWNGSRGSGWQQRRGQRRSFGAPATPCSPAPVVPTSEALLEPSAGEGSGCGTLQSLSQHGRIRATPARAL